MRTPSAPSLPPPCLLLPPRLPPPSSSTSIFYSIIAPFVAVTGGASLPLSFRFCLLFFATFSLPSPCLSLRPSFPPLPPFLLPYSPSARLPCPPLSMESLSFPSPLGLSSLLFSSFSPHLSLQLAKRETLPVSPSPLATLSLPAMLLCPRVIPTVICPSPTRTWCATCPVSVSAIPPKPPPTPVRRPPSFRSSTSPPSCSRPVTEGTAPHFSLMLLLISCRAVNSHLSSLSRLLLSPLHFLTPSQRVQGGRRAHQQQGSLRVRLSPLGWWHRVRLGLPPRHP